MEFQSEPIPNDISDLFTDIHDGEMFRAPKIDPGIEGVWTVEQIIEILQAIGFAGVEHLVTEEGARFVCWLTAVFLGPLLGVDALRPDAGEKLAASFG